MKIAITLRTGGIIYGDRAGSFEIQPVPDFPALLYVADDLVVAASEIISVEVAEGGD